MSGNGIHKRNQRQNSFPRIAPSIIHLAFQPYTDNHPKLSHHLCIHRSLQNIPYIFLYIPQGFIYTPNHSSLLCWQLWLIWI
jgi:hypothetical protein